MTYRIFSRSTLIFFGVIFQTFPTVLASKSLDEPFRLTSTPRHHAERGIIETRRTSTFAMEWLAPAKKNFFLVAASRRRLRVALLIQHIKSVRDSAGISKTSFSHRDDDVRN